MVGRVTNSDKLETAVGIVLGFIEVMLLFGMLYIGIAGLIKEVGKKIFSS